MAYNRINIHAGHNPDGKTACGATGYIRESTEARNVVAEVIKLLKAQGKTVYDCTCNNGTSQNDVLKKIVSKCNSHSVDIDISIHFNSFNGNAKGTEVLYVNKSLQPLASRISTRISSKLGLVNRGSKYNSGLYFLNKTNAPAILIECCFVDNKSDVDKYSAKKMAEAIVEGLLNINLSSQTVSKKYDTVILYDGDVDLTAATILNWKIKNSTILKVSSYKSGEAKTVIGVGGPACKNVKCNIEIIGEDRYDTIQKTLDYINSL